MSETNSSQNRKAVQNERDCRSHTTLNVEYYTHYFQNGQRTKKVIPGPFGAKKGTFKNQEIRTPYGPCHRCKAQCTCFRRDEAHRYTRVRLLWLTFNSFFCRFLDIGRPSIVPLCPPYENADVRGDPLHPAHRTRRHTSNNTRICLHTSAEIHRYDVWMPICTMATDGSVSAASEIEVGLINLTMQDELRAAAAK